MPRGGWKNRRDVDQPENACGITVGIVWKWAPFPSAIPFLSLLPTIPNTLSPSPAPLVLFNSSFYISFRLPPQIKFTGRRGISWSPERDKGNYSASKSSGVIRMNGTSLPRTIEQRIDRRLLYPPLPSPRIVFVVTVSTGIEWNSSQNSIRGWSCCSGNFGQ